MTSDKRQRLKRELTEFTHDLFLKKEYIEWRSGLLKLADGKWRSLIASLAKSGASVDTLAAFGEHNYSKFVFNCVKAPDFRNSRQVMVLFTISGGLWHSLIWHAPEKE